MSESPEQPQAQAPTVNQSAQASKGSKIFQVVGDLTITELNLETPDAGTALPVRTFTPDDPFQLVDRNEELRALTDAVDPERGGPRAVVLMAPRYVHGVGRSALVQRFARTALEKGWFPGGVHCVGLEDEHGRPVNAVRALPTMLAVLGTDVAAIPLLVSQQLIRYRQECARQDGAHGRMLFILDGVATNEQIDILHPQGAHRLLLIPNRPIAALQDLPHIAVSPLGTTESVELLRRSGALSQPNFQGAHNAYKLEQLAWICGGYPRALTALARYISRDPGADLGDLVRALAGAVDHLPHEPSGQDPAFTLAARCVAQHPPQGAPTGLAGRDAVTQWITQDWLAGHPARWELVGGPGTGKTSLLNALADRLRRAGGAVVLLSAEVLARTLDTQAAAGPADADTGILPFCAATVAGVAQDLAEVLPDTARSLLRLSLGTGSPAVLLDQVVAELDRGIRRREPVLRDAFFIDNLDYIPDERSRSWLLTLATAMRCPIVVSVHDDATPAIGAAARFPLPELSADQLLRFAAGADGVTPITPGQAARIIHTTGGLPAHVAMALAPILANRRNVDELLALYESKALHEGVTAAHLYLARQHIDEISRATVQRAEADIDLFDLMATLRIFDAPTLSALITAPGLKGGEVDRLVDGLCTARSVLIELDRSGLYQMHSLLSDARLLEMSAARRRSMHRRIEAVLFERMNAFEPGDGGFVKHVTWIKFEDPAWNAIAVEWFHHAASGFGTRIGHGTLTRSALIYFEAFWWWGSYEQLDICDKIVAEVANLTDGPAGPDRAWAEALATVHERFPRGWDKRAAAPGAWNQIADSLGYLLGKVLPGGPDAEPNPESGRLGMYLNIYLADCARYSPRSTIASAEAYHAAARKLARAVLPDDESWHYPWFDICDAEALLDAGESRRASKYLDSVVRYDPDDVDSELRCRYELAMARVALAGGAPAKSVTHCVRAVLRAYVYNIVQEEAAQAPSRYTRTLQDECLCHLVATLDRIRAHGADPVAAAAAAATVRRFFEPYWREDAGTAPSDAWPAEALAGAGASEVVARFAPALPQDADLGEIRSAFTERAHRVATLMEAELRWPPATPRSLRAGVRAVVRSMNPRGK